MKKLLASLLFVSTFSSAHGILKRLDAENIPQNLTHYGFKQLYSAYFIAGFQELYFFEDKLDQDVSYYKKHLLEKKSKILKLDRTSQAFREERKAYIQDFHVLEYAISLKNNIQFLTDMLYAHIENVMPQNENMCLNGKQGKATIKHTNAQSVCYAFNYVYCGLLGLLRITPKNRMALRTRLKELVCHTTHYKTKIAELFDKSKKKLDQLGYLES